MADEKEPKTDEEILAEAKERFKSCLDFYSPEYERGREDVRFLFGDQWDEGIAGKRRTEGRPCLVENRTLVFARHIANTIRQSRPSISVSPVDNKADPETAKILKGMIRNIEVNSGADNAYDTGGSNAINAGYGWLRVLTKYADDETFDQEIEIGRVPDFSSVMIDPASRELDGSDAEYGFVFADIDHEKFEAMYPDAESKDTGNEWADGGMWSTDKTIRVVEYFYKEYTPETITSADGKRTRTIQRPSVKWVKMTGREILEKTDWEGKYIPLVPVYGEEVWIDGVRKSYSMVTQAKDPQRRYNYWLSASTEIIALQPKAPYIGAVGQFKTMGDQWARANNDTFAYLEYDMVRMPDGTYAPMPQRQSPPMGSPAMFQEMMAAADGIKSVLGVFDASLGAAGNEQSGKAIIARQSQGDNATFHFVDNLQTSIRHVGRILVDLIPKIYSGPRIVRIIGDDGTERAVAINQAAMKDGDNLMPIKPGAPTEAFFDLNVGKYDVVASVGPSYASKRQETASTLQAIIQASPETFNLFGDIFFKNLDIAEADIMAERMRKANPIMNDEENPEQARLVEAGQMIQGMQQTIAQMDAALRQKREKDTAETAAEVQKMQAETEKIKAEAVKIQAEVAAMMGQIGGVTTEQMTEIVRTIAALEETTRDTAQAVDAILSFAEGNQAPVQPEPIGLQPTQEEIPPNV